MIFVVHPVDEGEGVVICDLMVTHINVMISSIGPTRDIGKKYLPSHELIALNHTII